MRTRRLIALNTCAVAWTRSRCTHAARADVAALAETARIDFDIDHCTQARRAGLRGRIRSATIRD
jgi:hypothetical protein